MTLRSPGLAAVLVLMVGCDAPVLTTACPDDLRVHTSPSDTVIRVGQSFTPTFQFLGCGGTQVLEDVLTFSSTAPDVLHVNATSGLAVGVASGSAAIRVTGARYGETGAAIDVEVVP